MTDLELIARLRAEIPEHEPITPYVEVDPTGRLMFRVSPDMPLREALVMAKQTGAEGILFESGEHTPEWGVRLTLGGASPSSPFFYVWEDGAIFDYGYAPTSLDPDEPIPIWNASLGVEAANVCLLNPTVQRSAYGIWVGKPHVHVENGTIRDTVFDAFKTKPEAHQYVSVRGMAYLRIGINMPYSGAPHKKGSQAHAEYCSGSDPHTSRGKFRSSGNVYWKIQGLPLRLNGEPYTEGGDSREASFEWRGHRIVNAGGMVDMTIGGEESDFSDIWWTHDLDILSDPAKYGLDPERPVRPQLLEYPWEPDVARPGVEYLRVNRPRLVVAVRSKTLRFARIRAEALSDDHGGLAEVYQTWGSEESSSAAGITFDAVQVNAQTRSGAPTKWLHRYDDPGWRALALAPIEGVTIEGSSPGPDPVPETKEYVFDRLEPDQKGEILWTTTIEPKEGTKVQEVVWVKDPLQPSYDVHALDMTEDARPIVAYWRAGETEVKGGAQALDLWERQDPVKLLSLSHGITYLLCRVTGYNLPDSWEEPDPDEDLERRVEALEEDLSKLEERVESQGEDLLALIEQNRTLTDQIRTQGKDIDALYSKISDLSRICAGLQAAQDDHTLRFLGISRAAEGTEGE